MIPLFAPGGANAQDPEPVSRPELEVSFTSEVWSVLHGGTRRGTRYIDKLDVRLALGDKDAPDDGPQAVLHGFYVNGGDFSEALAGVSQSISNIETGTRGAKLSEAWVDFGIAANRARVKLGLFDLNSEFDFSETRALFLNSSHGLGPDISQVGENGPSTFPDTSFGVRMSYRTSDKLMARVAVLDGLPGLAGRPKRTAIKFGRGDGAFVIGEIEYRDEHVRAALGSWFHTAKFSPLPTDRPASDHRRGNNGIYIFAEGSFDRNQDGTPGLSIWARAGFADPKFNEVRRYLGAGAVFRGPLRGQDEDAFGFAIATTKASRAANTGDETNFEVTYNAVVASWLSIQPNLQFVVNPAGVGGPDALIFGTRTQFIF